MRARTSLPIVVLLILTPVLARAQDGAHAPLVAQTAGGSRGAAMANAAVGVRDDEALWYDPAELAASGTGGQQPRGATAAWARTGNATLRSVAGVFQTGRLGIAVGARQLDLESDALPLAPIALGLDGAHPASSTQLTIAAAREVKGFRFGAAASWGEDRLGDARAGAALYDLGVARTVNRWWLPGRLHLAAAVQGIGGGARVSGVRLRPPTMATAGANLEGWSFGYVDLSLGTALSVDRDGRVIPRAGGELAWVWIDGYALQARAGLRRPEWVGQSVVTLGAGFVRDNLSLDYAFEPAGDLPASHRIGISVR